MATSDRQSAIAARPLAVFASVDTPADEARQWLTEHFDQQAAQGEPDALTPEQRLELAQLLSSAWWRAVFEDERGDEDLGGSGPAADATRQSTAMSATAARRPAGRRGVHPVPDGERPHHLVGHQREDQRRAVLVDGRQRTNWYDVENLLCYVVHRSCPFNSSGSGRSNCIVGILQM